MQGQIQIERERCKGCTFCMEFCPTKSISLSEGLNLKGYFVATFDPETGCNGCGTCALMCPGCEASHNWFHNEAAAA